MGLLTSDKSGKFSRLTKPIANHANLLSLVCFVAGIASLALMLNEQYCDRTYFSDNALLPGLVNREFTLESHTERLHDELVQQSKPFLGRLPHQWLMKELRKLGLEVYQHNFTLRYPFGKKTWFRGRNVYAILRAPRAPSTEAIVLSTPFRTVESAHGSTLPGVALMLSLAKYFSSKIYWAKDIIFLFGEHELVGIHAWLNAYHDEGKIDRSVLDCGMLEAVSGPIQGAINLEIHGLKNSRLNLKIEGLNGQLPNLDLFNVAVELATREGITPTFHGHSHPFSADPWETWKQYIETAGAMMISQAITLPTGAHGLFQKFAIQSLTIETIEKTKTSTGVPITMLQVGRMVEGIFRSLNNLLEKFNRSYWFYLLPSTRRYLSIGYYMISFGLMAVPLIFKALQIYLKESADKEAEGGDKRPKIRSEALPLLEAIPIVFFSNLFGIVLLSVPFLVSKYQQQFAPNWESRDVLYFTLITLSLLFMFNPLIRVSSSQERHLKALQCVALLNLALLLSCVSLINISLAFGLTFIYVPITITMKNKSYANRWPLLNTVRKTVQGGLLLLLHPMSISYLCLLGLSMFYDQRPSMVHFGRAYEAQKKVLLYYVEDWYIYGNWTYFFGCAFLFPVWFQFWHIL